ncbi:MAG: IS110 family transposase [Candidatus Aureabacteria bacterium]|nr:IS110 family transposase [Candidatus Auribacterota bacterium]
MEMTAEGEIRVNERARLEHVDRDAMRRWLGRLPKGTPVAMEAAFGWPWIADLLEESRLHPHLGHPPALKVLAQHEAKSDRCDGDRLAKFQLLGILPESYLAPPEVRQIRERTRYRMALSALRSAVKNRIQALLHRFGILHAYSDLFGKQGRQFLEQLQLPPASRAVLEGSLELLDEIVRQIKVVEKWMEENLKEDDTIGLLQTIPGIGLILAHVIRAEMGEISRFPSARHLRSYSGTAPVSDDSAERHGARHCSPACNHALRWAFIEAVTGVLLTKGQRGQRLRRLYARLTHGGHSNNNQAKVALAGELAERVFIVWKKRTPYQEEPAPRPGAVRPQSAQSSRPQENSHHANMRPDQSRHPIVRRSTSRAGQALS